MNLQQMIEADLHCVHVSVLSNFFSVPLEIIFVCEEEDSLVSGKSPKPPAAPPSASGPRATRVSTKIVVYGPQDASSPHSQGPLCCTSSFTSICALALLFSLPEFLAFASSVRTLCKLCFVEKMYWKEKNLNQLIFFSTLAGFGRTFYMFLFDETDINFTKFQTIITATCVCPKSLKSR